MNIRQATAGDCFGASLVQRAVIPAAHPYEYANNIRYAESMNLVAVQNDAVVGFISVLVGGPNQTGQHLWERLRPYIAFVGVLPDFQKRGIGTALIQCAIRAVLPQSGPRLWLECPQNVATFYENAGFIPVQPDLVHDITGLFPKGLVYYLQHRTSTGK
jgi:GNAT superfamily N-acetyltransferase